MVTSTVFDDTLDLLEGKFATDPAKRKGGYLTVYAAVKKACGVDRDDHAVAYNGPRWPALAADMSRAFAALDEFTAESSETPTSFIVWGSQPERTEREVRVVLAEAARRNPSMVVHERAMLRPSVANMPGTRKKRWVICNQVALIAAGRVSSVGSVVSSILPVEGLTDFDVIERLDVIIEDEGIEAQPLKGLDVAVQMSRAWGTKTRRDPVYTFARFIEGVGPLSVWSSDNDELIHIFERFLEAHKDDEAPVFGAPFLG